VRLRPRADERLAPPLPASPAESDFPSVPLTPPPVPRNAQHTDGDGGSVSDRVNSGSERSRDDPNSARDSSASASPVLDVVCSAACVCMCAVRTIICIRITARANAISAARVVTGVDGRIACQQRRRDAAAAAESAIGCRAIVRAASITGVCVRVTRAVLTLCTRQIPFAPMAPPVPLEGRREAVVQVRACARARVCVCGCVSSLLSQALVTRELVVVLTLCNMVKPTDLDDLCESLVMLLEPCNAALYVIEASIALEVATTPDEQQLFRSNSVATKLMAVFSKRLPDGSKYMHATLDRLVRDVCSDRYGSLEVCQRLQARTDPPGLRAGQRGESTGE
jgi:hypothetical protein